MKTKILYFRSEPPTESLYSETDLAMRVATQHEEAMDLMEKEGPFGVVLAETSGASNEGLCVLNRAQTAMPQSVRICVATQPDWQVAVKAVNEAHVYFLLPDSCPENNLVEAIKSAVAVYRAEQALRTRAESLQTGSLQLIQEIFRQNDPVSYEFGFQVKEYALALGQALEFEDLSSLETAALLVRVGRISLPVMLQQKIQAGFTLSYAEKDLLARAPELGCKLLRHIPGFESAASMILYQKKNYDGRGFPFDSVGGTGIPLGARILRLACDFASLEQEGQTRLQIKNDLEKTSGIYDPEFLQTGLRILFSLAPAGSRSIVLADLRAGHVLASPLETESGLVVLPGGQEVSDQILSKLRNFAQSSAFKEPIYIKT